MSVAPISIGNGLPNVAPLPGAVRTATAGHDFSRLVSEFVHQANAQQLEVGRQIEALAAGETDNVHDVVLSVAQADLAFRLVMEIRNRLIASYQEIMRMQV